MIPAGAHVRGILSAWIPPGSEVAIMDVPVHRNAGDLFILAVTTQLLATLDCRIVLRTGVRDYRPARARRLIGPDTILVGLGGGNFGDTYPRYQALRERVVADFPANRIVILPQTIHLADRGAREAARRRMAGHADLRIAVRDAGSLETARDFTSHVHLLPDIVHALAEVPVDGNAQGVLPPGGSVLLLRRDREGQPAGTTAEPSFDWPEVFPDLLGRVALAAAGMTVAPAAMSARLHDAWSTYADGLLARALARLSTADHIITDRLHAAILARLLGRRVTLRDNGYGKLASYHEAWWRDDPAVTLDARVRYSTKRGGRS